MTFRDKVFAGRLTDFDKLMLVYYLVGKGQWPPYVKGADDELVVVAALTGMSVQTAGECCHEAVLRNMLRFGLAAHLGEGRAMKWRKVPMREALAFARNRAVKGDYDGSLGWPRDANSAPAGVEFEDGSVVVGSSVSNGPYSEVTPDIDWEPPDFFIGEPDQ